MPHRGLRFALVVLPLLAGLVVLPGCGSIGPGRILADRTEYNTSLTESWKRQILLNIVKIRYVEPMFFMDVGDIVAGYSLETAGNAGFSRSLFDQPTPITDNNNPVTGNFSRIEFGVSGRYTDRPTITYKPMTGNQFRKGIMLPLPVRNVLLGLDTGISARFLFSLGVRSINGLHNAGLSSTGAQPAQPGFARAADLLARLQLAGALHVHPLPPRQGAEERMALSFDTRNPSPEVIALTEELRQVLDLDKTVRDYEVIRDHLPQNRGQIALQTFSLMQIMAFVSARVQIPEEDVASHRAMPRLGEAPGEEVLGTVAVHSGANKPADAFVAIRCRDHWFWVDDHDLATKRVFSFLMLAFTLMEEKGGAMPLQLTIPVQ